MAQQLDPKTARQVLLKRLPQKAADMIKNNSWEFDHWYLHGMTSEQIADAFKMMLAEPKWKQMMDKRVDSVNAITNAMNGGGFIPQNLLAHVMAVTEIDKRMGQYMLKYLSQHQVQNNLETENVSTKEFFDMMKDSNPEAESILSEIGGKQKYLMAITSIAEGLVLDINQLVKKLDKRGSYVAGDGIVTALRQARSLLKTDNADKPMEVQQMWADYYEAIEQHCLKKIDTAYRKEERMMKAKTKTQTKTQTKTKK